METVSEAEREILFTDAHEVGEPLRRYGSKVKISHGKNHQWYCE